MKMYFYRKSWTAERVGLSDRGLGRPRYTFCRRWQNAIYKRKLFTYFLFLFFSLILLYAVCWRISNIIYVLSVFNVFEKQQGKKFLQLINLEYLSKKPWEEKLIDIGTQEKFFLEFALYGQKYLNQFPASVVLGSLVLKWRRFLKRDEENK